MQKIHVKGIGYFGYIYLTKKRHKLGVKFSPTTKSKDMRSISCGQRIGTHFVQAICTTENKIVLKRDFDDMDPIEVSLEVKLL